MADRHIQIKGIPLIKFQSKEKIEKFQQGKMYMKSLEWYRNNAKISAVGDDYEAMLHINEGTFTVLSEGESEVVSFADLNDALIHTTHRKDFVFCMFSISPQTNYFAFTDEQRNNMLSFGDTALLIKDSEEFYIRVRNAMKKEHISLKNAYCGRVEYYDESVDSLKIFISLIKGMHNVAFQKRKKYSYQQEYRILVPYDDRDDDFLELDIGDISDISEIISAKTLLKSFGKKVETTNQEEQTNG